DHGGYRRRRAASHRRPARIAREEHGDDRRHPAPQEACRRSVRPALRRRAEEAQLGRLREAVAHLLRALSPMLPPSVLPDISPTRGEISRPRYNRSSSNAGDWRSHIRKPISPLVGEMAGWTEGGNVARLECSYPRQPRTAPLCLLPPPL